MKKRNGSLKFTLLKLAVFPMLIMALIITVAGSYFFTDALDKQAKGELTELNNMILNSFNEMYPGDYKVEELDDGIHLCKGEHQFNGEFDYIDQIKLATGCDVSICYLKYVVATTLVDDNNERIIGYAEQDEVYNTVVGKSETLFYDDAYSNGEQFYAFYGPLINKNGDAIGMLAVSKPAKAIKSLVWKTIIPLLIIALFAAILICFMTYRFTQNLISQIRKIQKYMKRIADGDFKAELDYSIDSRDDELGQMADSAVRTASSLRKMVEEDLLTSLYNRRSADSHLKETVNNFVNKGVKFCLAIGDIDFFKKVNDTYGHEAGDLVLQAVASTFKNYMLGKGYPVRWGGEEFLLIFEGYELDGAADCLVEVLDKIRALEIISGEHTIKVTMTYGLVECNEAGIIGMDEYISRADQKLYYGKEHGRNQIVKADLKELQENV